MKPSKSKSTDLVLLPNEHERDRKGNLKQLDFPAQIFKEAADASEPFRPVVDKRALDLVNKKRDRWFWTKFMTAAISGAPIGLGTLALTGAGPTMAGLGLLGGLVTALLAIPSAMIADANDARRREALRNYSAKALARWLEARYSMRVSVSSLTQLTAGDDFLINPQLNGKSIEFMDADNRRYQLVAGANGDFSVQELLTAAPSAGAPLASAVSSNLAALLPGDAKALHERTAALIENLGKRSLSTEAEHVLRRVTEDVRKTLLINRELQEVAAADETSGSELAAVFAALNEELDEVLAIEQASVRDTLRTQLGYIKGRRRHVSALQLPAASSHGEALRVNERADRA